MSPDELAEALTPFVELLEARGIDYEIGGSLASATHGVARTTLDADVVAALTPADASPLVAMLADRYYVDLARVQDAIARRRSFNLIHLQTMLKIDVFVRRERAFDVSRAGRAALDSLSPTPGTRSFRISSAEDIILAKLEWFRVGGGVSERQWGDVLGVLRVGGPRLDRAYPSRWAAELGVADLLEQALGQAEAP